jgi:hypothetical protein
MKVIFLDIDGVLNTERYLRVQAQKCGYKDQATMQYNFDPVALDNLKEIIEVTNANIVISSTWRLQKDSSEASREWKELIRNFDSIGVSSRIIGVTPTIKNTESLNARWMEIKQWLQDNTDINIEKFVIIDDEWDMGEYTKHSFARCWSYSGLTNEVKETVLSLFSE